MLRAIEKQSTSACSALSHCVLGHNSYMRGLNIKNIYISAQIHKINQHAHTNLKYNLNDKINRYIKNSLVLCYLY